MMPHRQAGEPPLGYADLYDDEALIVTLYRYWCLTGPTTRIAEHRLAVMLRHDGIYASLDAVFGVFRCFTGDQSPTDAEHAVLHSTEEDLLDFAARSLCPQTAETPFRLRRIADIPRSGRDQVERLIAHGYSSMSGI